jgi:hypothetical protein
MIMGNLVHTSTTVLRRDRLERVGGFDETLRQRVWQPRLAKDLFFAALPFGVGIGLRRRLKRLKARLTHAVEETSA